MKIDSHQHFWKYHPVKDAWITDAMKTIQRDFLPDDLWPLLQENGIDGCVAVQADQSEAETEFLLQLAESFDFIKGVVGWVDLRAENVEERLAHFAQFPKLKGFRHIVQSEPKDDFLLNPDFCRGVELLSAYDFTYDLLIFPRHLPVAETFVSWFPEQRFVLDHLAKPDFKTADFTTWEQGIRALAAHPNVCCKVSGMVTEADWNNWKAEDFSPCLAVLVEAFGLDRLLFGSDWPVCLLAASYGETCDIVRRYFAQFPVEAQEKLWGGNATAFYHLT